MANVIITELPPNNDITRDQLLAAIASILPLDGFTDGTLVTLGSGGRLSLKNCVPRWQKFTVTYAQLAFAGASNYVTIFNLPSGGVIHQAKIKHSTPFTGGAITGYTLSLGLSTFVTKYAGAFDVHQAVGASVHQLSAPQATENSDNSTAIVAAAASAGANLNQATAGSADVWLLWSATPL